MEAAEMFQPDGEGGVGMEMSEQNNGEKPQPAVASSVEGRGEDSGGPIGPRGEVQRRRKLVQSEIQLLLHHPHCSSLPTPRGPFIGDIGASDVCCHVCSAHCRPGRTERGSPPLKGHFA